MKNILKIYNKKIIAMTLMCLTFLTPLTGVANASPKHGNPPPKQVQHLSKGYKNHPVIHHQPKPIRHDVRYIHHAPPRYVHHDRHHDDVGVLIGGLILGTIIGAAIADAE
ncbi:MAG: hypothetical protein KBS60_00410 [Phascolarctobacterium sp.]|nr:hypothetical protein [Candidatus Phascolarctobacterium caballi]